MEIRKEQFETMTIKAQNITIYDAIISLEKKIDHVCSDMNKKKARNSIYSFIGGIIGGIIAVLANWAYWSNSK